MPADEDQQLLEIRRRPLAVLERQRATFGDAYAPPHVLVEIEELRGSIAALEAGSKSEVLPRPGAMRFLALVAAPLVSAFRAVGDRLAAQSRLLVDSDPEQSQALLDQALALRQVIDDGSSEAMDELIELARGEKDK